MKRQIIYWEESKDGDWWGTMIVGDDLTIVVSNTGKGMLEEARKVLKSIHNIEVDGFDIRPIKMLNEQGD